MNLTSTNSTSFSRMYLIASAAFLNINNLLIELSFGF
jgi:hypothetical protein